MKSIKDVWPTELRWSFIAPEHNERLMTSEEDDDGFWDADFGPFSVRVIVRKDGRFQAAFSDGDDEIDDGIRVGTIYATLEAAKYGACLLGHGVLLQGERTLLRLSRSV